MTIKRVLKPHGQTVGWLVCARCKAGRKDERLAVLSKRLDGSTALFLPDAGNATVFRGTFGKRGRPPGSPYATEVVWIEYSVTAMPDPLRGRCRRHGSVDITPTDVLNAIGSPDTPRSRAV